MIQTKLAIIGVGHVGSQVLTRLQSPQLIFRYHPDRQQQGHGKRRGS